MSLRKLAAQRRQTEQEAAEQGKRVVARPTHRFPVGTNLADLVNKDELLDVMREVGQPEGESSRVEEGVPTSRGHETPVVENVLDSSEELEEDDAPLITNRKKRPVVGESSRPSKRHRIEPESEHNSGEAPPEVSEQVHAGVTSPGSSAGKTRVIPSIIGSEPGCASWTVCHSIMAKKDQEVIDTLSTPVVLQAAVDLEMKVISGKLFILVRFLLFPNITFDDCIRLSSTK